MVTSVLGVDGELRHKLLTSLNKLAKFKDSPVITAGSICTGWGVGDMVIDAVNANLNRMCEDAPKARMGFGGSCRRFQACFIPLPYPQLEVVSGQEAFMISNSPV